MDSFDEVPEFMREMVERSVGCLRKVAAPGVCAVFGTWREWRGEGEVVVCRLGFVLWVLVSG